MHSSRVRSGPATTGAGSVPGTVSLAGAGVAAGRSAGVGAGAGAGSWAGKRVSAARQSEDRRTRAVRRDMMERTWTGSEKENTASVEKLR